MISSNAETIQKSFTEQAKNFETKSMCFTKQEYLEHMVSSVNPQGSDSVLEVAAGTCVCGRSLAPFVQSVICLDMTPAMLAVGKDEAEKQGLCNIDFMQGDAEKLPFLDNSFDIVISRLAFHHFSNPKQCFSEMARVLKAGGKLVIIDMEAAKEELRNTEDEIEILRDPSHMRNLSKEEFTAMFREELLKVTKVDVTEIPVSLSAWIALTNTPAEIYFNQRWVMIIGENGLEFNINK